MLVELRVEARRDLTEAAAFYDAQREGLGDYFMASLLTDLESLATRGGIHEIAYGLHRKLSSRFPFAIYYRVAGSIVNVVAILDCRRDPESNARRLGRTTP